MKPARAARAARRCDGGSRRWRDEQALGEPRRRAAEQHPGSVAARDADAVEQAQHARIRPAERRDAWSPRGEAHQGQGQGEGKRRGRALGDAQRREQCAIADDLGAPELVHAACGTGPFDQRSTRRPRRRGSVAAAPRRPSARPGSARVRGRSARRRCGCPAHRPARAGPRRRRRRGRAACRRYEACCASRLRCEPSCRCGRRRGRRHGRRSHARRRRRRPARRR